MNKVEIIFEDKDMIVCHKPAGMATQTRRLGQQDMENFLKNYRAKKGEPPYIGIVHRLDQPVEGVMVFAKNQKAASNLSKQVQQHMIGKYYYAVSRKTSKEPQGVLENYLLTDKKTNYTQVIELSDDTWSVTDHTENAKKAKLEYKAMDEKNGKTLFDIRLHTGRQHQIRVQMAHMGCPLIGDNKYGMREEQTVASTKETLALCSYRLEFEHPSSHKKMDFRIIPCGEVFQDFLIKSRL